MALTEAEELELLELEEAEKAGKIPQTANSQESVNKIINSAIREKLLGPVSGLPVDAVSSFISNKDTRDSVIRNLPTIGGVAGGLAGSVLPTPARAALSGVSAGGGEAIRQIVERARGNVSPETSADAAAQIAKQAGVAATVEAVTPSALKFAGKVARPITKTMAKAGAALSGTRPINLMRAYSRGLKETYLPAGQEFVSRASAGAKQADVEEGLFKKFFNAEERAALKLQDSKLSNKLIKNAMVRKEMAKELGQEGAYLTPKQALGTLQAIDSKFPTPLSKKQGLSAELSKIAKDARAVVSEKFPEYSNALKTTEKAITRSQLSKPLRVTRSNPDEFSNVFGAGFPYTTPTVAISPLMMGLAAGSAGSVANAATSPFGSRLIAQSAGNPLFEALIRKFKKKEDNGR